LERIFLPASSFSPATIFRAGVSPSARKPLKSLGREMHEFRGIVSFQRLGPDFGSLFLCLGASPRRTAGPGFNLIWASYARFLQKASFCQYF
jgi:hypothetical protein